MRGGDGRPDLGWTIPTPHLGVADRPNWNIGGPAGVEIRSSCTPAGLPETSKCSDVLLPFVLLMI